ncbi:MAG: hypothetical protein V3S11_02550 [Elusimicrobiota bacterium]
MSSSNGAARLLAFEGYVDGLLERSIRRRLGIRATLDALLPAVCRKMGATAAVIRTRNVVRTTPLSAAA